MPTPRWLVSLFRKLGHTPRPVARSRRLLVESLEDRSVPAIVASGAAPGELPVVRTFDDVTLNTVSAFFAFDPSYRGGVNVAMGDVTGDGTADVIAATAGGAPAVVRVFDGASGAEVRSFFALDGLTLGVNVASGDVDGDGRADIVVSANAGAPIVRVFSGATGAELTSFFAFDPALGRGVEVAVADVDGDGRADIVAATGAGGFTGVRTFDGATGGAISSFLVAGYDGPISLAAGDVDGDGRAEVLLGLANGIPAAGLFDGLSGAIRCAYAPFGTFASGLSVGIGTDTNGDGIAELIFGANGTTVVGTVDGATGAVLNVGTLPVANVGNLSGPPAVNGAPTVTLPATFTGNENTPLALTGISVADPDAGTGTARVSLGATNGTLSLATDGLTFATGDGTADAAMTFTGTLATINAALAGLTYLPNLGYLGADTLTVAIDDQGNTGTGGSKTATATSAITVNNVNDPPTITSNGGGSTASTSVAENATAVTTVTATDPDLGTTLTYSISGGADAALFSIDANTGALTFNSAPDFESPTDAGGDNTYDVVVRVSDGALFDDQAIAVTVTALNDNAPAITSNGGGSTASTSVAENTTAVTTVTATDGDAGSTLTFSISGGADSSLFSIDANTGALTFNSAPDFESPADAGSDNVYDVVVQVSDGILVDTQAIAVSVTDANDNSPTITSNGGGTTASTSASEGQTAVTTVTATDADASAALTYSIVGGADSALFSIDSNTGVLTFISAPSFAAPADAGANNVYDVTVQVSDGTNTDTQEIAVTVTELNLAPVVTTSGGTTSYTVNDPGAIIDAAITVTDANASDMMVGATVDSGSGNFAFGDVLAFDSALATGFGISGSYDGGPTGTGVLTFTGSATPAQYQAVLRTVTFATSVNVSVTLTFTFTVNDGDATGSGTKDVNVNSI